MRRGSICLLRMQLLGNLLQIKMHGSIAEAGGSAQSSDANPSRRGNFVFFFFFPPLFSILREADKSFTYLHGDVYVCGCKVYRFHRVKQIYVWTQTFKERASRGNRSGEC